MNKKHISKLLTLILISIIMLFYIGPVVWMVLTSIQPQSILTSIPPRISLKAISFGYYNELFRSSAFVDALKNSFITSLITTVLSVSLASLGAYAVTRIKFPGRSLFLFSGLSMQMGPAVAFLIPLFIIIQRFNLFDTQIGLICVFLIFIAPVAMWLMLGFFESIPKELEEAAYIDGCSKFYAFYKIILPIARPGLLASGIVVFISVWGDLLIPLTLTMTRTTTLTVFASSFSGIHEINYGGAAATSVISALPTITIAIIFRKFLIKGLTEGSVKG